ncbi:hypothetical protein BT96DRAFT_665623 [Gymnopus androsaceus JB14]|uniref:Uncharacterized protein n=1 Tax=Gymnopus androsaceus JB14 TaxID=1447944 RepID=A0A6A4IH87_9AGAR|nr:hypothetical protein BT96DRAFT_665623 [Gymnopus androsaceus JB14]
MGTLKAIFLHVHLDSFQCEKSSDKTHPWCAGALSCWLSAGMITTTDSNIRGTLFLVRR